MTITYLKKFFTDKNVASITPTSKVCIKRICSKIDFDNAKVIVEFGPGGGCFTRYLLKKIRPDSRLIAIDFNKGFYDDLKKDPELQDERFELVYDSVENVRKIMDDLGVEKVDAIVSGVPFAFFPDELRRGIISGVKSVLQEGGKFLIYQFYPRLTWKGKPLEFFLSEQLHLAGKEIELPNIPPLVVYEAVKKDKQNMTQAA